MPKQFFLVLRARTRWNVELRIRNDAEIFVSMGGALGWLESSVSREAPVQAPVNRDGGEVLESAWFFEKGTNQKLNVIVLGDANA